MSSFLARFFTDADTTGPMILAELNNDARDAGIRMGSAQFSRRSW